MSDTSLPIWVCGHVAFHHVSIDGAVRLDMKIGVARVHAGSKYEADGMLRAVLARYYPPADGWQLHISMEREDDLYPIYDPDTAGLMPPQGDAR